MMEAAGAQAESECQAAVGDKAGLMLKPGMLVI